MSNKQHGARDREQQTNKQTPLRVTPQQAVAEAEATLRMFEQKRAALAVRADEIAERRKTLAFNVAAAYDGEANREVSALREESRDIEQALVDMDSALAEARRRLSEAQALEAKAQDREQAKALRRALTEFVDAGRRVDHALGLLAKDGHALTQSLNRVHALGAAFPTTQQMDSLGHLCLRWAIQQTPRARSVETVPPGQRRSFASLVESWASNIEQNNIRPRLGEQTNSHEAA
jgi:hypothetical protein